MKSMPDFFGSLQSLIGISPALTILLRSDSFSLNRDSLELRYSSVIEEDSELTLIMPRETTRTNYKLLEQGYTNFLLSCRLFQEFFFPFHSKRLVQIR